MTTVAARSGVMACDSMIITSGNKMTFGGKIVRGKDFLLGMVGTIDIMIAVGKLLEDKLFSYLDTIEFQGEWHTLMSDCGPNDLDLLLMHKDKLYFVGLKHGSLIPCGTPFWAIGSGMDFAIGAMASGKSAELAMSIACAYGSGSGLHMRVEHLQIEL